MSASRLVVGSIFLIAALAPCASEAQPKVPLHPEHEVARWFAPIVWPAVNETTVPTIPHPAAFDGVDNDGDGDWDLDDLEEVRFGMSAGTGAREMMTLIGTFPLGTPPRRVIYSGPRDFDREFSDVLEYWFYYLYDQGPGAHAHDPEHAFLFLDVADRSAPRGSLRRYKWQANPATLLSPAVRIVVAAAHEGSTANNIIAATRNPRDEKRVIPRELPTHVPLLAELGKHASAPDLHLDGRFDAGLDANLFRGSIWGLRDSLASGLGEVGFMTFEPWQSFPRQPAPLSVERSYFEDFSADFLTTYRPYVNRLTGVTKTDSYALFPMADMERLYELLRTSGTDSDIAGRVTAFLLEHRSCFWGDSAPNWSGAISPEVLRAMQQWALTPPHHIELWKHLDHVQPRNVFKLHLFPKMAIGAGTTSDVGYDTLGRFIIELSDLPWPALSGGGGLLEFLFPGRLLTDSRLELAAGTEGPKRRWPFQMVSATWKKGRGNRSGLYIGLQFQKAEIQDGDRLNDQSLQDVSFETGVPIEVLRQRKGGSDWPPAIRTGVFFGHSFPWARAEFQAGIVVEPRGLISDVERALGARENLRFQFGSTFTWNAWLPSPWK